MPNPTVVLITGCSSGIGYELVKLFDRDPYKLAVTVLPGSYDSLMADPIAASKRLSVRKLDVADYRTASDIVRNVESTIGPIDILINNAGISYRSTVEDMSIDDEQRQMQVNYLGPIHLVRECLPSMRQRKRGRIINVSSVGGMMAMPTMASYSASKFALEGASEALWYEVRPWNIRVTLVRPGFINSLAFQKVLHSKKRSDGQGDPSYDMHYRQMTNFVERFMRRAPSTSQDVALRIFKIANMANPPLRAAGTPDARLFYFVRRLLPRYLYHRLLYKTLPKIHLWGKSEP